MSETPATPTPAATPYARMGGEAAVRHLVTRFYDLMDTLPEARACRATHGPSLDRARERLFEYLSYWLGGPTTYTDKYGHPMLRARHLHASIGTEEITGWIACFRGAWAETVDDAELEAFLLPRVEALAWHMRTRAEDGAAPPQTPCG